MFQKNVVGTIKLFKKNTSDEFTLCYFYFTVFACQVETHTGIQYIRNSTYTHMVEVTPLWILEGKRPLQKACSLSRKINVGKIAAFPQPSAMLEDSSDIFQPDIRIFVKIIWENSFRKNCTGILLKILTWKRIPEWRTLNVTEVGKYMTYIQKFIQEGLKEVQKQRIENLQCS